MAALIDACAKGCLETVRKLVDEVACSTHVRNVANETPLFVASASGSVPVVAYLLSRGAQLHCRASRGRTPLHAACAHGHIDMVRFLIEQGCDVNEEDFDLHTPLYIAAVMGNVDLVNALLSRGANIYTNILYATCEGGHADVLHRFEKDKQTCPHTFDDGMMPFHLSCKASIPSLALYWMERGADVNEPCGSERMTPLMCCCSSATSSIECLTELIQRGARLNDANRHGETALHIACRAGHLEAARSLLRAGASSKLITHTGSTPFYIACGKKNMDMIQLFADHGQLEQHQLDGALRIVCSSGYRTEHVISKLLSLGASLHETDGAGCNALHYAFRTYCDEDFIKHLVRMGGPLNARNVHHCTPFEMLWHKTPSVDLIEFVLLHGADITHRDIDQRTALHHFACTDDGHGRDMVRTLVRHGADVHAVSIHLQTPLHLACGRGLVDVATELLLHGSLPFREDRQGQTPFHIACNKSNMYEFVKLALCHYRGMERIRVSSAHKRMHKLLAENGIYVDGTDARDMSARGADCAAINPFDAPARLFVVREWIDAGADVRFVTTETLVKYGWISPTESIRVKPEDFEQLRHIRDPWIRTIATCVSCHGDASASARVLMEDFRAPGTYFSSQYARRTFLRFTRRSVQQRIHAFRTVHGAF
jgi:ankyrin repeat protein